ncbi:MAG: alcohol dehydrogenase catalytic domain-containing protein [Candidatus Aenigmarchaeota archaeon]|nr:alcohol dehydrogenase catalytic domain-containing protein [Candidatus Aenigmarchaeota archaeon]
MKVAMYYNNKDIRLEEVETPKIGGNEILVKVMASGICGSDVMEWYRIKKAPKVLGHEISGEITEVGEDVRNFKKGDRVFVTHHVPCEYCFYCKEDKHTVCDTLRTTNFDPGGFSEYVRIPKINIEKGTFLLPKNISFEEGTFIEPLGCVIRGQRIADIRKNHIVLVLGSGISGLLHIKLAKSKGCKVIATDVNEFRMKKAREAGADLAIPANENVEEKLKEFNEGKLADRVIVSTGAVPAIKQALTAIEKGGTILFFAPTDPDAKIEIPLNDLWFKCATITTSYAAVRHDLQEAIELMKNKKIEVKDMITHRLPLKETERGFRLVTEAKNSVKVIIEPWK